MNSVDLDFLKSIYCSCKKNNVDFTKMEFTFSKLTEWIFSYYKICRLETAKQKVIYFSENGFLCEVNKGFRFSKKSLTLIELYNSEKIKNQQELNKALENFRG
jgi:hypothetical protein